MMNLFDTSGQTDWNTQQDRTKDVDGVIIAISVENPRLSLVKQLQGKYLRKFRGCSFSKGYSNGRRYN